MYAQNNTNQSIPISSMQYPQTPLMMQPLQPEYNNANGLYIPAPMPNPHSGDFLLGSEYPRANEMDMASAPTCMRTMMERYIGKIVRAQFLIGDALHDHVGRLMSVGSSYIVIESLKERVITICDLFSIKFVTVMFDENDMEM